MKIKSGDLILSINDKKVGSILDVSTYINTSTTDEIKINVLRNNEELTFNVIPQIIKTEDSLGNVIMPQDYSELGMLMITASFVMLVMPILAIYFVKKTKFVSA